MDEKVDSTLDRLLVEFGKEILQIVPGKVSTEVDARFSFDIEGSVKKALHIIDVCIRFECCCPILTRFSSTKISVLTNPAFSSSSPRHGRGSRQPTSYNPSTVSIAISPSCSHFLKQLLPPKLVPS